jgi:hypothetical protein
MRYSEQQRLGRWFDDVNGTIGLKQIEAMKMGVGVDIMLFIPAISQYFVIFILFPTQLLLVFLSSWFIALVQVLVALIVFRPRFVCFFGSPAGSWSSLFW